MQWFRSRPESVKALARRLPPLCVVRAARPFIYPAPGELAIVCSYYEGGTVTVIRDPSSDVKFSCDAEWLEVVAYRSGITPAVVEQAIGSGEKDEKKGKRE